MASIETRGNQSVGKALKIIEILAEAKEPMRLMDIAAMVKMPPSTVLRMIATLTEHDYIAQDEDSQKYFLTLKFARIGSMAASRFSIRDAVHPYLVRLSNRYGEASCMAIDSDMMALYVDVVDGPDGMLRIMQHIGKQSPLHCSGVGKCLLLNYNEKMIDALILKRGLPSFTSKTICTKAGLLKELQEIRERGFAIDDQECEEGARCIACGISDPFGKIVAAISVSGPVNRMTNEYIKSLSVTLLDTAKEISKFV